MNGKETLKEETKMKKTLLSILVIAALSLTCLVGCQIGGAGDGKDTAASVFTLDINPSVRFYVDENGAVITVEGVNEDGEAVVSELEIKGEDFDVAVEKVLDAVVEAGYAAEAETSVLVTVEKSADEIKAELSDKINERIDRAFEKHGKAAKVIEQELDDLAEDVRGAVNEIAERYDISKGKANVIEKIRGEFPELSEEELAGLKMNDLALILGETGEDVHKHFKKFEKALSDIYVGAEAAVDTALADAFAEGDAVTRDDLVYLIAHLSRDDGKMIYEVEFAYGETEYEYEIDAESGEILEKETDTFENIDIEAEIDKFFKDHGDDIEDILKDHEDKLGSLIGGWIDRTDEEREQIKDAIFGKHEQVKEQILSRTEALAAVIEKLEIDCDSIESTKVKVKSGKNDVVISIEIETESGDEYEVIIEAYSGTVIKAELNGTELDITDNNVGGEDVAA